MKAKWEDLARKIATNVIRDKVHISFIVRKNELLSIGTNEWKTHPKALEMGYGYPRVHSELNAYTKLKNKDADKLVLMNYRFSPLGKLGMAKPCKYCLPWCLELFTRIIYSDEYGIMHNCNK